MDDMNGAYLTPPDRLTAFLQKTLRCAGMAYVLWLMFKTVIKYLDDYAKYSPINVVVLCTFVITLLLYCVIPLCSGHMRRNWIKAQIKTFFSADQILLLVLLLLVITSSISMNLTYGAGWIRNNAGQLADAVLCVCLCYTIGKSLARNGMPAAAKWIALVLTLVLSVVMIWAVIGVCKPSVLYTLNGKEIALDNEHRLRINCNPNTTGAISAMILMMCVMAAMKTKGVLRALWLLMIPVHFSVLTLSYSRSAYYGVITFFSGLAAILVYDKIKGRKRIPLAILTFAVSAVVLFYLQKVLFTLFMSIAGFISEDGILQRENLGLNGRRVTWYYSLRTIVYSARNFFFGSSPAGVNAMLREVSNNLVNEYTHNMFLQIAVGLGVPGLAVFIVWLIRVAKRCLVVGFGKQPVWVKAIPLAVLALLVTNMAEAVLLFYQFFTAYFFFVLCGYVVEKGRGSECENSSGVFDSAK